MKNSKNYENYRRQLLDATENKDWSEQLDAGLCLVELCNKKACIAQHVVALVAGGNIEHALQCIEQFASLQHDESKRKFIIYMLCLLEMTLLKSNNNQDKSHIDQLLEHFKSHFRGKQNFNSINIMNTSMV